MSKKEGNANIDSPVSEVVEKQEKKTEKNTSENVIYLGPNIPNVVSSSTVFRDGILPDEVNKKIKELPMLSNLFVPISKMIETVKELSKAESSLHIIYAKVEAGIKEED